MGAYDMRGWGKSDAPQNGYSIADLASEAASLMQSLRLTNFILIGHSMGGKVAQLFASRRPLRLVGLILAAPAKPTPTRFSEEMRQQQIHAYDSRENVIQTVAFLSARTPSHEILEQIVEDSLAGSPGAKLAWPTSAIMEDMSNEVPKIKMPTLIVAGGEDRLDPVEQHRSEVLPRIPKQRMEILTESGHLIPIDEPDQLAAIIQRFATPLPR